MTAFSPLAHLSPDAPVALGEQGDRTAGDLVRDARAIARRLPPPRPGSEVLVVCGDRYHVAVAALAAWLRGHAVALPPNAQPEAVRHLAARPEVVSLLHDADAADAHDLREWLAEARSSEHVLEDMSDWPWPFALADERPVATVYSSGSTGDYQPCAKTAGQLLGEARTLARTFALRPGQVVLATVPPHHLYGLLFSVLAPLAAGAAFVRDTPLHAETVAAAARRYGAAVLVSVPVHLRSLTVLQPSDLPALSRVFSSGAPLPRATAVALDRQLGLQAIEVYGASETGGIGWRQHERGVTEDGPDPAWTPLPGVRVDASTEGRLMLESPFLPPDAGQPFPCQDRVELAEGGGFHLRGRLDGVVKVGGKRVAVAELEHRLLALPGVVDAAVIALEVGGARGHELAAAVVPADPERDAAAVLAELRHGLLQWFDPVVLPRRIKLAPQLPREANGKLQRRRLLPLLGLSLDAPVSADSEPRVDFELHGHVRREESGGVVHELQVLVPLDLAFFRGHFAGYPVLPGVAQLAALVVPQVAALHPALGSPRRVDRLRFRRPVAPGDDLSLRLEVRGEQVRFSLRRAGEVVSDGVLDYAAVGAASAAAGAAEAASG